MSKTSTLPRSQSRNWLGLTAVIAVLGASICTGVWYLWRPPKLPEGVSHAEYSKAEGKFRDLYGRNPSRIEVLSLLGELAVGNGRPAIAVECFREIPSKAPKYGPSARLQEAQVLMQLNRVRDAERSFQEFLALATQDPSVPPDHVVAARKWLGYLLSVELRFEERKSLLADAHTYGHVDVFDSKQYYFPHLLIWHSPNGRQPLTEFLEKDLQNLDLQVALGRYRTFEGRLDDARVLLEDLYRKHPNDLRCAAALLECHFERNDWAEFSEIAKSLPSAEDNEPWLLSRMRGQFALHERRWEDAVRNFERVLEADPAEPASHMSLARAYTELQRPKDREEMLQRSLVLAKIRANLGNVTENDSEPALELALACEQIGLREAAETFRRHAARIERANGRARSSSVMPR